ncbi:MAG: carbon-nitrogen hydrolase family protein [Pseudomonadota bacterium]
MSDRYLRAAAIQLQAGPHITENLQDAAEHIRAAAASGAKLVVTPENTCHILASPALKLETACCETTHLGLPFFSNLAHELGIWLVIGSLAIKRDNGKLANRQCVFAPDGKLVATYDKIHLFDADLANGESYRESAVTEYGDRAVMVDMGPTKIGLSICYDVRFAKLYRTMAQAGAEIMLIPAAFAIPTGRAHWHVLVRARAIETGSYVLAPAQCGTHDGGRGTYGHSLIISPWGDCVAEQVQDIPGFIIADLDLEAVRAARSTLPTLTHDREFVLYQPELAAR